MARPKYALSAQDLTLEMKAIRDCQEILNRLDGYARDRVLTWLRTWANAEAGGQFDMEF